MNKFNLLAEPYSMEQLAEMIDQSIKAAQEEFAGMEKVQAEIHEAEHALELLSCQYNMLSLVADKDGVLAALNANGALESLCNKKIEEITAAVAVESLGEKVVEALKKVWEFIQHLLFKISQWITKLTDERALQHAKKYIIDNMKNSTVVTIDDGTKYLITTKDTAGKIAETMGALLKKVEIVEKYTKLIEQTEAKEKAAHDKQNVETLQDLSLKMDEECDSAIASCKDIIEECATSLTRRTLTEAGVGTPADAVKYANNTSTVDTPARLLKEIEKVGDRIHKFGDKVFHDDGVIGGDAEAYVQKQVFIQTAIAVRTKIANITKTTLSDAFRVQYEAVGLLFAIYKSVKIVVDKEKKVEEPAK